MTATIYNSFSETASLLNDLGLKKIFTPSPRSHPSSSLSSKPLDYFPPCPAFIYIDLFCGGGGTTIGLRAAKNKNGDDIVIVAAAVNHDPKAILSHWRNHPEVEHFEEDIRTLDITRLRRLMDLYRAFYPSAKIVLWASCECTNLSKAKGGLPRDRDSRTLANDLFRYIEELTPDYIQLENVQEFLSWGPLDANGKPLSRRNGLDYLKWKDHIEGYGYRYDYRLLNAADFGAHTKRIRYFGIFAKGDLPIAWPRATHAQNEKTDLFSDLKKWLAVKEVLNFKEEGKSILASLKPVSQVQAVKYLSPPPKVVTKKKGHYVRLRQIVVLPKAYTSPDIGFEPKLVLTHAHAKVFSEQVDDYAKKNGLASNDVAFYKYDPLTEKTLGRVYAGLIKYVAGGEKAFFQQANTGRASDMVTDINQPCRTLTATAGNLGLVQAKPLKKSSRGQTEFITKYYGNGGELSSVEDPAGALTTKDRMTLVKTDRLDNKYHSSNQQLPLDKFADTNLRNAPGAAVQADERHQAARHHYLMNPQYNSPGNSVDDPCFTLIARMDKAPPHLVTVNNGMISILLFNTDSENLIKIKRFMALYGIVDIKMRMLSVPELKRIQGFPENYFLAGNQADQKKFIGNAVVPVVPQRWVEALATDLLIYNEMKIAA